MSGIRNRDPARVVTRARAALLALLCAVFVALGPSVAHAYQVLLWPQLPDGYYGWRTTVTSIVLIPDKPGRLQYQWDGTMGEWSDYTGPVFALEGRRTLFVREVDDIGRAEDPVSLRVKVDYQSIRNKGNYRPYAVPSQGATGTGVSLSVTVNPAAGARIKRLGGQNRFETAVEISRNGFPSSSAVVLATGADFADALSAAGLAGSHAAPILLTQPGVLPLPVSDEITRLGARNVIIVGGTKAVSPGVESGLRARGFVVTRIGGRNRYATAAMIAEEILRREGSSAARTAYVARGDAFPDALAVSPFAYAGKRPLLLVQPTALPDATRAAFLELGVRNAVIAGGKGAVSDQVEAKIRADVGSVSRVAGKDRYYTASEAAQHGVESGLGHYAVVGLATGRLYPDALCGGAALGKKRGVLLLVPGDTLGMAAQSALDLHMPDVRYVEVYGGEQAVSPAVFLSVQQLARF